MTSYGMHTMRVCGRLPEISNSTVTFADSYKKQLILVLSSASCSNYWISLFNNPKHNLWIPQRVAPYGNRTRYTLRGSRLPSPRTKRAV
ncbi:hypothetical protein SFRURICE_006902 [Spodoptera frugiperda]|nr:hypothetical protein SFRURICE_006902 [Spodoptera frugiperda]